MNSAEMKRPKKNNFSISNLTINIIETLYLVKTET